MKRAIASVCISGDLRQKIDAAAFAGFQGIEILENDLLMFDESPAVVRRMVEDAGMEIVALQPFRDFEAMPAERMQKNFDRVERKFDVMEELGTDTLLFCSNVSPHALNDFNRAIEHFSELSERAAKRDFHLGYEALSWGRYIKDYRDAWRLVSCVDRENFGLVLDTFHIFALGLPIDAIREIPGHKITLVQLADAPQLQLDVLSWSRHFRCFPGQGDFPISDFVSAALATGYSGYFSHEIFNDQFRSSPCRPSAVDGMRSLLWLEEEVANKQPALFQQGTKRTFAGPPAPSAQKIEFIEFAAEAQEKDRLVNLLSSLGFVETHRHNSKDVSLYRLGDVCIVVNEEPDSFAQNYYLVHGVSVCALAFLASDAEGMLERAEYFGYKKFEGDIENGEMDLCAVKGVGGEVIYFIQDNADNSRFFDRDFTPIEHANVDAQAFSMGIDHVASGLSETEFLPTSLFFKLVFGLEIAQPLDLIDPYGIVVSRTATNQSKSIRLPFNMSKSWGTSTERFREGQKGSGVQHIAISCDDIFAYTATIDRDIILPIPKNYYVDLQSKFDLDDDFVVSLQSNNILYDRSETGEFFHFYTAAINGVFFEVVQRNQYANYGEVNAQVRMSAQARLRKLNTEKEFSFATEIAG